MCVSDWQPGIGYSSLTAEGSQKGEGRGEMKGAGVPGESQAVTAPSSQVFR